MLFWFVLIFSIIIYYLYREFYAKRLAYPPGPMPWPIVGNIFQIDEKYPHKTVREWSKIYGPVFTIWLPTPQVLITNYEIMKNSIIKDGDTYTGRPSTFFMEAFTFNSPHVGIVMAHGPYWKEQRRFALHVLRDFGFGKQLMEQKIGTEVQRIVDHVSSSLDASGKTILKPHDVLSVCIGSIISCLVFGHPYEYGDKDFLVLKQLLNDNLRLFTDPLIMLLDSYPWLRHLPFFGHFRYDEMMEQERKFRKFFYSEIDAHRAAFEPDAEPTDYLDAFLKEKLRREQNGLEVDSFHDDQLFYAAFDLWGAGMETTATTLSWAFLYLIHYPEIQDKIHKELDEVLGPEADPALSDRSRLPYLSATLNEIQRHGNIVPFNLPHTNLKEVVLNGHPVPINTTITPQISAVLTDPEIFPNPDKFDPERFLDGNGNVKKVEQLIPFSLGKRVCLGESLARMELFLILASFMHKFKLEGIEGQPLPTLEPVVQTTSAPVVYELTVSKR